MNIMVELALIFGVCLAGEGISAVLPFAFPASVIAMLLLGALLFRRGYRLSKYGSGLKRAEDLPGTPAGPEL